MPSYSNDCWPTHEQKLLLRAVLLKGQDAIDAWEQWITIVDFNDIDYGSQRLLPLLYQNLLEHRIKASQLTRYKGVYRRFWLSNQLLFNRIKPVLAALHEAGIEILFFKGAGLVVGCGLNYALRPMDDIDFLVPGKSTLEAIKIIEELGWQPKSKSASGFHTMNHAATYHDGRGHFVDLHWHSLMRDMTGNYETGYWERSFSASLDEIPVKIMGITDQLIHICIHGIRWNWIPPIRWIADAVILIETSGTAIDWDYLVEHSEKLGVTLTMYQGLRYLKNEFDISVPDHVLRYLKSVPVSRWENWEHQLLIRKPLPVFGGHILAIINYRKYHQDQYMFPGYFRYLQERWDVASLWQVPFEGVLRMWRNVKVELFKQNPESISVHSIFHKK
ncbi:nucleotidyltransferase family protein [bacterium]|nr:nucleotidyltransferase family protein [bacterium]